RSLTPPFTIHQPLEADPSPPTLSLPMKLTDAQTDGWKRYFTSSFMPFWAASVMAWVHEVPAVMAMNTSGFLDARVVIGSVMVGADGSIVPGWVSILSLMELGASQALKPPS